MLRVQRKFVERFAYQAIFRCRECGKRRTERQWYLFLLGGLSTCPQCGTHKLKRLTSIDRIDSMYSTPFSYLQKYFGANLHHCGYCRLQFYDYRKREADLDRGVTPTAQRDTAQ